MGLNYRSLTAHSRYIPEIVGFMSYLMNVLGWGCSKLLHLVRSKQGGRQSQRGTMETAKIKSRIRAPAEFISRAHLFTGYSRCLQQTRLD